MPGKPLFDLEPLRQLSGGDESFVKHMLEVFDKLVQETTENFQSALEEKDWEKASKAAHKIKPSLDQLRIESLQDTVREIEAFPKKDVADYDITAKINEMIHTLEKVTNQLKS